MNIEKQEVLKVLRSAILSRLMYHLGCNSAHTHTHTLLKNSLCLKSLPEERETKKDTNMVYVFIYVCVCVCVSV